MTTQSMTATEIQEIMNTSEDILNSAETYNWTKSDLNLLLEEIQQFRDDVNYVTYLNKIIASLG